MKGILTDVHMTPEVEDLVRVMQQEPWTIFWEHLGLVLYRFKDFGLAPDAPDLEIWHCCQAEQLIFITNNRNKNAVDSLEAAIRADHMPTSLPVFTIGKLDRLQRSKAYADRVVKSLYGYLLAIDRVRGAGRLYLP